MVTFVHRINNCNLIAVFCECGLLFSFSYLRVPPLFPAGLVHDDLKMFLLNNIPTGKKKSKVLLGVSDPKLGATIQETLEILCTSGQSLHLYRIFSNMYIHNVYSRISYHRGEDIYNLVIFSQ